MTSSLEISSFVSSFQDIPDPRMDRTKKYKLIDIIVIAVSAVICGAKTWYEIEDFGKDKFEWFDSFLNLKNGIPSHDTFNRFFSLLDPLTFQTSFYNWVFSMNKELLKDDHVILDGKRLRRSFEKGERTKALHMVNAFSSNTGLTLTHMTSIDKTHEMRTIPIILDLLDVKDSIVSIDALGCYHPVVNKILEKQADYVIALKDNQKSLFKRVKDFFKNEFKNQSTKEYEYSSHKEESQAHGRIEKRTYTVITEKENQNMKINTLNKWQQLKTVIRVRAERTDLESGETQKSTRYYISSSTQTAEVLSQTVRNHWWIENKLHWMLDVHMREDDCRKRNQNSGQNFSTLRHLALNLLKAESSKRSIPRKQKSAGWNQDFLLKVLLNNGAISSL